MICICECVEVVMPFFVAQKLTIRLPCTTRHRSFHISLKPPVSLAHIPSTFSIFSIHPFFFLPIQLLHIYIFACVCLSRVYLRMRMCVHVCLCIRMYVCVCVYMSLYLCTWTCVCVCVCLIVFYNAYVCRERDCS